MRHLKKLYLLVLCLICIGVNAQYALQIDSLKKIILKNNKDSNFIKASQKLSYYYLPKSPDSAIKYAQFVLIEKTSKFSTKYKTLAYAHKGYAMYLKGLYQLSIETYKEAADFAKQIKDTLNNANSVMNEGNVYIELGKYPNALDKYRECLEILKPTNYENQKALANSNIGFVFKETGNFEKAETYIFNSLKIFEKLGKKSVVSDQYNLLAVTALRKNEYKKALDFNSRALIIQKEINYKNGMAVSYQLFGQIYTEQRDFEKAITENKKASAIYTELNDTRQIAALNSSIGNLYRKKGDYVNSIPFYITSIVQNNKINNKRILASAYLSLSNAYLHLEKLVEAKQYLDSAEIIIEKTNNKVNRKTFYEFSSEYYYAINKPLKALEYFKKFNEQKDSVLNIDNLKVMDDLNVKYETEKKELKISLLNKTDSIKSLQLANQQIAINKNLYDISQQKLALADADLQMADDSLQLSIKNGTILQNKLDAAQKEERIKDLNKEKQIQALEVTRKNIAIVAILVFAVLIALLGYSFYKRRTLQQQAFMQATLAKQQENATIEIIQAEEKERKRIAEDLHDGVGQLMTAAWLNLQALDEQMQPRDGSQYLLVNKTLLLVDESCKEVRQVSHNMMPNALLRKGLVNAVREFTSQINTGKLSINLQTEELQKPLESHVEAILYRVIQESVNNVVKHAQATQLDISINQEPDGIDVMIEDNGKGFDTTITRATDGIGLQNIISRIHYLKGTVEWNSSEGNGTLVAIHIPITT